MSRRHGTRRAKLLQSLDRRTQRRPTKTTHGRTLGRKRHHVRHGRLRSTRTHAYELAIGGQRLSHGLRAAHHDDVGGGGERGPMGERRDGGGLWVLLHKGVGGRGRHQGCGVFVHDVEIGARAVVFVFAVRVGAVAVGLGGPLPQPVDRQTAAGRLVDGDAEVGFAPLLDGRGGLASHVVREGDLAGDGEVAAVDLVAAAVVEILCREKYAAAVAPRAVGGPAQNVKDSFVGGGLRRAVHEDRAGGGWLAVLVPRERDVAVLEVFHGDVAAGLNSEFGVSGVGVV